MESIEIKLFNNDEYKIFTKDTLNDNLKKIDIKTIALSYPSYMTKRDGRELIIMETDYEHPFTLHDSKFYINHKYYFDNKEEIDLVLEDFLKNYQEENITINSKELIDDRVINALINNPNLRVIALTPYAIDPYVLKESDYLKFKKSTIKEVLTNAVDSSLKDNFDPLISYNAKRFLIGYNRYKDLTNNKEININDEIDLEMLKNLIYVNEEAVIKLDCSNYSNIKMILDTMSSLSMKNKVIINLKEKENFNNFLLTNKLNYLNLYVNYDLDIIPINEYLRLEKKLYDMIFKARHLSPFEKYIVAYNIVKKYKKYRESEDKEESRNLYKILENEFIVCRGFTVLFQDLLNKLGINNASISVTVDTSYDLANKGVEAVEGINKVTTRDYHSRCYVRIKDEKYQIDGFYITDPTWDNVMDDDYYNHLALTEDEIINSYRYNWLTQFNYEELLAVHSIEEFYQKINFFLDKLAKNNNDNENLKNIINGLIGMYLENLAPEFVDDLTKKYPFLKSYSFPPDLSDLLYDLGEFIVNHVNKEIKGDTILRGIEEVYKSFYGYKEEDIPKLLNDLCEKNALRQDLSFPRRKMINKEDEVIILNQHNKFLDVNLNIKNR